MPIRLTALAAALMLAASVHAADKVKVGFVSTLSGPGAGLGVDIRDGFNLAVKELNGKLGGLPAEVLEQFPDERRLRMPMRPQCRSLNLSNAVAVVVYEAWRQAGFAGGA